MQFTLEVSTMSQEALKESRGVENSRKFGKVEKAEEKVIREP